MAADPGIIVVLGAADSELRVNPRQFLKMTSVSFGRDNKRRQYDTRAPGRAGAELGRR
jgi:hypothetical protein